MINELGISSTRSPAPKNAFVSAHTIIGVRGKLIVPIDPQRTMRPFEVTRTNHLPDPDYQVWLNSETAQLARVGINVDILR